MEEYSDSLVRFDRHPSRSRLRGFGFALALLCCARAAVAWSATHSAGQPAWASLAALLAAAIAWLSPELLRRPYILLDALSYPIRWLAAFSILALLYFALITPVAWLFRLTQRSKPGVHPSAWHISKPRGDKSDYFRQF